jgi:DNA-directed RNA polymerase subunit M
MFCPKCKALMLPDKDTMRCHRCGYTKKKTQSERTVVVSKQREQETVIIEDAKKLDLLPRERIGCPKCNHNEAYWILRQTRRADEPETRIYTCVKCGYRWRAY